MNGNKLSTEAADLSRAYFAMPQSGNSKIKM